MARRCPESKETVSEVNDCPKNRTHWEKRRHQKRCQYITNATCNYGKPLEYHCLLNAYRNESLEVCAPDTILPAGICPEYSLNGERINAAYDCKKSFGKDCPDKQFHSNETYKYQRCLQKNTLTEEVHNPPESNDENLRVPGRIANENIIIHVALILNAILGLVITVYLIVKYVQYKSSGQRNFYTYLRKGQGSQGNDDGNNQDEAVPLLKKITILLVGKTGSGKSSTGNTILGETKFEAMISGTPVTKMCLREQVERNGQIVSVIDTPGLFDTDNQDYSIQFNKMEELMEPGLTAIIIVVAAGSIDEEELEILDKISSYFKDDLKNTVLLFTRKDDLDNAGKDVVKYILKTTPQKVIDLYTTVPYTTAFDNMCKGEKREKQVKELLSKINNFFLD